MDHIEKAKKDIRENWFKDHRIKQIEGEDGLQRITWGAEGTSMYQIKYTLSGNMVFISGDVGDAVYCLTCPATLENLGDFDLSYFTGKLSTSERKKYSFNEHLAREEIKEYILDWCDAENTNELSIDDKDLYDELIAETNNWSSCDQFSTGIYSIYSTTDVEWFDSESASCISDCGKELSRSLIAYWVGLQMIGEQLKKKEKVIA